MPAGAAKADGPGTGTGLRQGGEVRRPLAGARNRRGAVQSAGRPGQKTDKRPERAALPGVQRRGGGVQLGGRGRGQRQRAHPRGRPQAQEPRQDTRQRQGNAISAVLGGDPPLAAGAFSETFTARKRDSQRSSRKRRITLNFQLPPATALHYSCLFVRQSLLSVVLGWVQFVRRDDFFTANRALAQSTLFTI